MTNKPQPVEILDEDFLEYGIETYITDDVSEDIFDRWKREELEEENLTTEGVYLGDGVYA